MKHIDLTGQKFGELTAIKESPERLRNEIAWICKCSCGEETIATKGQLLHGWKKSCGCLRKKTPANALDLTGRKFGKLTVIERAGKTKNDNALWLCRCECGGTKKANATSLRRGEIVSCGCLKEAQIDNARKVLAEEKSIDGVQIPLLTKKVRSDSSTGHKGVHKRKRRGKEYYEARITIKGQQKHVGTFKNIEDAIAARKQAELKYHAPFIKELEVREMDTEVIKKWIEENLVMQDTARSITGQSVSGFNQSVAAGKIAPFVEFGESRKTRLYLRSDLEEYAKNKRIR